VDKSVKAVAPKAETKPDTTDLTVIAAKAFRKKNSRRRQLATAERDALIARLLGPLWGMAWRIARPDHDLAEELRAHVLLKCEMGCYDPAQGEFAAWVRTVMSRHLITLVKSRGRSTGGDDAHPERIDYRDTAPDTQDDDDRTAPFSAEDMVRIAKWGSLKRVLLLSRSLLWRKVPPELWAAALDELGLPAAFPGYDFEDLTMAERNSFLADMLGVPRNTIHVRVGRWEQALFDLKFVRDLRERV
jgi:DNA-directed RNA polymerase specialized sigma24 family protein